jgi:serine/threonine protein kinase
VQGCFNFRQRLFWEGVQALDFDEPVSDESSLQHCRQSLADEIRALRCVDRSLSDSHFILSMKDSFLLLEQPAFTMELLTTTLTSAVDRNLLNPEQIRANMCALMRGLACLHRSGLAHRDIKSDNLMLDSKFVLRIYDFGLVKFMKDVKSIDDRGSGTLPYLPNECLTKIGPQPNYALVDAWCAGLVVFQTLEKRTLFDSSSVEIKT